MEISINKHKYIINKNYVFKYIIPRIYIKCLQKLKQK